MSKCRVGIQDLFCRKKMDVFSQNSHIWRVAQSLLTMDKLFPHVRIRTAAVAEQQRECDMVVNTACKHVVCESAWVPIPHDKHIELDAFDPLWNFAAAIQDYAGEHGYDKYEQEERIERVEHGTPITDIVVVCETGRDASCVVGVFLAVIMEEAGFCVDATQLHQPSTENKQLNKLWKIGCSVRDFETLEDEVYWYLNGEPVGPGVAVHGENY